jgi:hypothetical protein
MKLKLDTHGAVSVLSVSGPLAASDLDVLKAGLAKLQAQGQSPLLVDLTQAQPDSRIRMRLLELYGASPSEQSILAIASPDAEIATAPSVKECLALLSSPSAKLLAQEARLKGLVARAKSLKAEISQKLNDTAALGAEIKKLRRENSGLGAAITALETGIQNQLKNRRPPAPILSAWPDVQEILTRVFANP